MKYLESSPQRQVDFVFEGEHQLVSFVGKFENLQADLRHIFEHLSVDKVTLPHANSSKRDSDFMKYFKSEKVLLEFNNYFREDFIRFGYSIQA